MSHNAAPTATTRKRPQGLRGLAVGLGAIALLLVGLVAGHAAGGTGVVEPPPRVAFLANGLVPADALAAGPVAGRLGAPLFTTPADSLSDDALLGVVDHDPELVVVLGGTVAVAESVIDDLATATGLPVLSPEQIADGIPGIVRVAGADRFATARAVAALVAAFDPAFLPVDATAVGAMSASHADAADHAEQAGNAELLGGIGAAAYARTDRSCDQGLVATGIAADGNLHCTSVTVDGGDADTVDGLHADDLVVPGEVVVTSGDWTPTTQAGQDAAGFQTYGPYVSLGTGEGPVTFVNRPTLPAVVHGVPMEIVGVEVCVDYSSRFMTAQNPRVTVWQGFQQLANATGSFPQHTDACERMDFDDPVPLMAGNRHVGAQVTLSGEGEMALLGVQYFLRPVES